MKQKIFSLLVLLLTAATGAWADVDLTNKVWQPGDTFNIGEAWFYRDNSSPGTKFLAINADVTVPDFVTFSNSWYLENIISASNAVAQHSGTVYFSNPLPLTFVMPEGKTSSNKPMGFKIASGDGTQDSPYMFGLVYPDVEVTTNKATGATTFTEAEFFMPAFDATVEYELVRDMSVQMTTKVGDGADGADYRIRLKKNGNTWQLADISIADLMALITVTDEIENKDLAFYGQDAVCDIKIFAIDDNNQPTGDAIAFANLTPGRYVAKAVAADGSDYDGETPASNVIVLFQGYEITVPAGEFVTYYKDEPLYADPETSTAAKLYTVSSVSDGQAVLSDAIQTAPSLTPLLVYNSGATDETFLLIPTDAEPNLALTVYDGFQGTLTATEIPASTTTQTNYALNGKQFVYVKNAIAIAANKCWLEVSDAPTGILRIVFGGETTGIDSMVNGQWSMDDIYDLSGRKANGQSSMVNGQLKKGVYIKNGNKVVIK